MHFEERAVNSFLKFLKKNKNIKTISFPKMENNEEVNF